MVVPNLACRFTIKNLFYEEILKGAGEDLLIDRRLVMKNKSLKYEKMPNKETPNKETSSKEMLNKEMGNIVMRNKYMGRHMMGKVRRMAAAAAAIENDDLEGARSLAKTALNSNNAELKEMVIDALGWFGEAAMAELTPFMSDANEDVAEKAADHWKDALQEMSDDGEKAGIVEMSLNSLRNKDLLEDVANELIGMDEVAALQVLVNVIEGDNKLAVEAAQDTYESITGEKWAGVDAAEQWLQDNYKPPDDDE